MIERPVAELAYIMDHSIDFLKMNMKKKLYNIIREVSFLCVALTLTIMMVNYTNTINELIYI